MSKKIKAKAIAFTTFEVVISPFAGAGKLAKKKVIAPIKTKYQENLSYEINEDIAKRILKVQEEQEQGAYIDDSYTMASFDADCINARRQTLSGL